MDAINDDYEYAKAIFEMRNESNKVAIWECGQEEFDEVWTSLPGNTPWIEHFNRWVGSPSASESERSAKSVGKANHTKFLKQPPVVNPVEVAQQNYAPIEVPKVNPVQTSDLISSTTNTINELTQFRQAQANLNATQLDHTQMPNGQQQGDFLQSLVLALVTGNQNAGKDDPLVVLKQPELNERATERARSDQQMMLQLMQQNSDRNMQMMFELMRGNGNRSTIEEQIMTHAVSKMLDPPEERGSSTLWQDISESGVLEQVSRGLGAVVSGMRQVPAGSNPYEQIQQPSPQQNMLNYAQMNTQPTSVEQIVHNPPPIPQMQQQQQPPAISFEDKCQAVFEKCAELGLNDPSSVGIQATPEQWNAILQNAVVVSVQRGEFNYPQNVEAQLHQAIGELNIVLNARRLGGLLDQIKKGLIGMDQVASVAKGNPLFEMIQELGTDGIVSLMTEYSNVDAPDIKIIGWDIQHLLSADNRPIIEQVLSAVN